MRSLPLKLAPGSDLRLSLEELAQRDGISGFVLGVVGNLTKASFQCPGQADPTVLQWNENALNTPQFQHIEKGHILSTFQALFEATETATWRS